MQVSISEINEIIDKEAQSDASLIAALEEIQERFHYLPPEALILASERLGVLLSQTYSVATFYNAFSLKPKGKYCLHVCMGTACHVRGSPHILNRVESKLGIKAGETTGVALVEVQPGKWGPVKYIVALDLTGKVTNLAVMSYVEQRGRPISTRRFLGQFIGKTGKSPITVGKDVDAVSGATISSRATAFAVKKVIALYETVCRAEEQD